jgi:hypothetical protein
MFPTLSQLDVLPSFLSSQSASLLLTLKVTLLIEKVARILAEFPPSFHLRCSAINFHIFLSPLEIFDNFGNFT